MGFPTCPKFPDRRKFACTCGSPLRTKMSFKSQPCRSVERRSDAGRIHRRTPDRCRRGCEIALLRFRKEWIIERQSVSMTITGNQQMTQLLEQALEAMRKLPSSEQDALAAIILEEIADERRWDEGFARTQPQLAQLAEKVRTDIRAGRVKDVGIDEL